MERALLNGLREEFEGGIDTIDAIFGAVANCKYFFIMCVMCVCVSVNVCMYILCVSMCDFTPLSGKEGQSFLQVTCSRSLLALALGVPV